MKLTSQNLSEIVSVLASVPNGRSLPSIKGVQLRSKILYGTGFLNLIGADAGEVILAKTKPEVGVTNFDGIRAPKGKAYIVKGVRFLFDTTTGVQAAGIKTAKWESKAPVQFLNGEININQSGQGDLCTLTGTVVSNNKNAQSNADDFVEVAPFVWRSETDFGMRIVTAGGPAVDQAFKYEFDIVEVVEGGKE